MIIRKERYLSILIIDFQFSEPSLEELKIDKIEAKVIIKVMQGNKR